MSVEGVYITKLIGDLRADINTDLGKVYATIAQHGQDTKQLVNGVLEQYQKLIPPIERKIAALKKAVEDELHIDISFDPNGHA